MPDTLLTGRSILIVEDEYMIAIDLECELNRAGAIVIGAAASLDCAIDLIENTARLDAAILDVSLAGEMVYPAADLLSARGISFLLTTGYDQSVIPLRFSGALRCQKPIGPETLSRSLVSIMTRRAGEG